MPGKKNEVIVKKVELKLGQYKMVFRCLNCGTFFEVAIQKGLAASKANPDCPYCGLSKAGSGTFETILANSEFDKKLQFYP